MSAAELLDDLEVFVVVHEQDLLLECEQDRRFSDIPRLRYVFVGMRPTDKLTGRSDVVIARDLADNIEQFPNLLSFTGWYAVAQNNLATARYVSLLEYDVKVAPDFVGQTLSALRTNDGFVGYVPFPLSHPMYLHATPWLISALAAVHQIDVAALIYDYLAAGGSDQWSATTNASMSAVHLRAFVDWLLPVTCVYRHDPIGAHVHERTLNVFCLLHGLDSQCLSGLLTHAQRRSHQILAVSQKEALERATGTRTGPPGSPAGSPL